MSAHHWNRCDVCGQFVPMIDFVKGVAVRRLLTPDSHLTREEYETLCAEHADDLSPRNPSENVNHG